MYFPKDYRLDWMINAFLKDDYESRQAFALMANQRRDAYEYLAAYWLDNGSYPQTGDSFNQAAWNKKIKADRLIKPLQKICRELTKHLPRKLSMRELDRYAVIGEWPTYFPPTYGRNFERTEEFFHCTGYRAFWAWYLVKSMGSSSVDFMKDLVEGNEPRWKPAYQKDGKAVVQGLIYALESNLTTIPNESRCRFAIAFYRWCQNTDQIYSDDMDTFFKALWGDFEKIDESQLQTLACFFNVAAYELGKRKLNLRLPEVQKKEAWLKGYLSTMLNQEATYEKCVAHNKK